MIYMLHSVGNTNTNWIYRTLSIKLLHIENLFRYLNLKKVKSYFLKDLYDYNFQVPPNGICLTFDDGYADNWVYLFPLLKKYNIKATIFVNPEFVDQREIIREQFGQEVELNEQDKALGFLSWQEMIEMQKSNLVDIQSHSMSHTWYFTGSKLIDYFTPQEIQLKKDWDKQYPWISWNEKPETKPFTHNSSSYFSNKIGMPILENGRSLGIRKYFLDPDIEQKMIDFTRENMDIFKGDWSKQLNMKFNEITKNKQLGSFESETETKERYWYELKMSKDILEKKLNKSIEILCWPGGAYNDISIKISEEAGYLASTIASREAGKIFDNKGKKYKRIPRISLHGNIKYQGVEYGVSNYKNILIYNVFPNYIHKFLTRAEKFVKVFIS